jgi:hypothetical protein
MKIQLETRYRCDGCGIDAVNPQNWRSMMPLMAGTVTMVIGSGLLGSQDYCPKCLQLMLTAIGNWPKQQSA